MGALVQGLTAELRMSKEFFDRATKVLTEEDSAFAPADGMMTVSQQVAHAALTVEWFIEGAQRPEGFDMDFEAHMNAARAQHSLTAARAHLDRAYAAAIEALNAMGEAGLHAPLPDGPVMGGAPKLAIVGAIAEHSAHHRGALSVYTRLLGKTPPIPYMDV